MPILHQEPDPEQEPEPERLRDTDCKVHHKKHRYLPIWEMFLVSLVWL